MNTRTLSAALAGIISFLAAAVSAQLTVTTVINNGLREPYGVAADSLGNFYACDSANNRIVRVDASTQAASTLAGIAGETGSNDGPPDLAHFNSPQGLLTVSIGGVSGLLVADSGNNLIRFVRFSDGVVTTLAGQTAGGPAVNAAGSNATFHSPIGLDQDANGNIYIADWGNNTIRVVNLNDPAFGITNVVISGTSFNRPMAVAVAGTNQLWVADTGSQMIKLITLATPTNGNFTAWVGGDRSPGTNDASFGPNARFNSPSGLLWLGGVGLLISDTLNNSIRLATNNPAYGVTNYAVVTFAGISGVGNGGLQDGSAATAKFNSPIGLALDIAYNGFLVADLKNNVIRRIQTGPPPAPVPSPAVGWVDFTIAPADVVTVLRTDAPFIFHNDVTIAIAGTAGAEIHFTSGPTGSSIPNPDPTTGGTPPFYRDGMFPNQVSPSIVLTQPDLTVKAIGFAPGRRSSDVVSARFQFKTANPVVNGNNAAMFTVTDQTDGAQLWYTIDGTDPTNAAPSLGPITSGASLSLNASFNLTFRICAFRANYLNSDIITAFFSPANFVPNSFRSPMGIALDTSGAQLYVADPGSNVVYLLHLDNNQTETFLDASAGIFQPVDVVVDATNNVYVLNQGTGGNGSILQFDQFGNLLGTNAAGLAWPTALAVDSFGNIFVAERGGAVQQFNAGSSNTLFTITNAGVQLQGIALFSDGTIALSDAGNHVIWQVNPVTHAVTLLTGTPGVPGTTLGSARFAKLNQPYRLARAAGNRLVAADYGNNRLVVVDRAGSITNVLNSTTASVWYGRSDDPQASSGAHLIPMVSPVGLAVGSDGGVYASEVVNKDIRKIPGTGLLPPPPLPYLHLFRSPMGIALDTPGAQLYIADAISNAVQVLHLANNQTETFLDATTGILQPVDVVVDATNNVYVLNQGTGGNGSVLQFDQFGNLLRTNAAGLAWPTALAVDSFGNVFVAEQDGAVQQFNAGSSNTLFTITNAGVQLQGIALFSDGTIALSDAGNHVIWQVNPVTRAVTLLTGTPGVPGTTLGSARFAKLNQPYRLARAAGNLLVAADYGNNRLVVVDRAGAITNVLNSANASVWYGRSDDPQASSETQLIPMVSPVGVALGSDGGVYASEVENKDIRKIPGTGLLPPPPLPYLHLFRSPMGIALDTSGGQLYIADFGSNAVQVLHLGNNQTETFLDATAGILQPVDVVVDATNNVYVLNQGTGGNGSILQFDQFGNLLRTNAAGLAWPTALAVDSFGNVFVAERDGAVQQFNAGSSNTLFTITNAGVQLQGIALFSDGTIVVSDAGNHVIWQVNPVTRAVTLLTGTPGVPGTTLGSANFAKLNQPYRLTRAAGNRLVAADYGNNRLVVVDRAGTITNVLNSANASVWYGRSDDPQASSETQLIPMVSPVGVALGSDGGVYASEVVNKDIRKIPGTGLLPPPPLPYLHLFGTPMGIAENWSGSKLYIADFGSNAVQVLHLGNNQTETFLDASAGILNPVDVVVDYSNHLHVLNQGTGGNGSVLEFNEFGNLLSTNASGLTMPTALTVDNSGYVFIVEQGGAVEQFISGVSNTLFTITNAGVQLEGIALFDDGTIAVSDAGNHVIWQVNPATKVVSLLTGTLGVPGTTLGLASFAKLNQPYRLARAAGNLLVAADYGNNRLVVVDRDGTITDVLNPANASVWYARSDDPQASTETQLIPMVSPVGVVVGIDGGVYASEVAFYDIRRITGTGLLPPPPPPPPVPVPAPALGWVDYTIPPADVVSVLRTDAPFIFNNDVTIAIAGTAGAETLFTFGPTGGYIPYPDATTGGTPPFYRDGMFPIQVPLSIILPPQPDVTIKAIGVAPGRPSSDLVTARFQFKTANPVVAGNNAAMFTVTDQTIGAEMWYTIDGSDPTNAAPSLGPITSVASLSLSVTSNLTFKVRAFRANYQSSGIVSTLFSSTNFVPNCISFGFDSGEASSDFIASPGQFFYAPVTLNPLPNTLIYSLQFNLTVTNAGPDPGPALAPGGYSFQSFLEKPIPGITPPVYERIPPLMFEANATNPPPPEQIRIFDGLRFLNMVFTNSALNLLGVGWLERAGKTNLYDTTVQQLISFSQAHDTMFTPAMGKVVLGGYGFQVPANTLAGQTYQIQIGRPSATSDGVGAPGSDVYIATPTNGSLAAGTINSIKIVTAGQRKYLVGDCAPFRWFNAGDFGNTNLNNSDVMQVFQSAIYSLNNPPDRSDFFDSMDSCGRLGVLTPNGYYTGGATITDPNVLFDGNDTTINQIPFGDGVLDVCDVYVTFRRSLDPSLYWFRRFWTNGVLGAEALTNQFASIKSLDGFAGGPVPKVASATNSPSVNFAAADFIASAGETLQVPITATIFGDYPLRVLMLSLRVESLDGSPALTSPLEFKPNAALGSPDISSSTGNNNYAATWLNIATAGLTGTATLGTLTVTIPADAPSSAAYAIHFDHASASPNGIASFPKQTLTGLILMSDRSGSIYGDGIPDSWRFRYFGTANNILSQAAADADGDGASNWHEYIAGTDPTDPKSVLRVSTGQAVTQQSQDCVIHWPSVADMRYLIERSATLFEPNWIPVSTNTGTGTDMEFLDSGGGTIRFYRVNVTP